MSNSSTLTRAAALLCALLPTHSNAFVPSSFGTATTLRRYVVDPSSNADTAELFQRSLLAERLRLEKKMEQVMDDQYEEMKNFLADEVAPPAATTSNEMSSFAFQRALLEAHLEMEARRTTNKNTMSTTTDVLSEMLSATPEATKVLPRDYSAATRVSIDLTPLFAPEEQRSNEGAMSPFEFQRSLLQARLDMETREMAAIRGTATAAAAPLLAPTKAKKDKPPSYWSTISSKDVSSNLIKAFTPEKGLRQFNEDQDAEVLGFAASNLVWGIVEGGLAAYFGLRAVVAGKHTMEEPAVKAAGESTRQLISALVAFIALALRQGNRFQAYAEQMRDERIEAVKRAKLERERIVAEKKLEEERIAAEIKVHEVLWARAEEAKHNVDEKRAIVEEKLLGEIRKTTEMKKDRLVAEGGEQNEGTKKSPGGPTMEKSTNLFFANEEIYLN
jgi:hypothetical protein